MYTGYFGKMRTYAKYGLSPICIARVVPKWYTGEVMQCLAPSYKLLKLYKEGKIDWMEYEIMYRRQIDGVFFENLEFPDNTILLCYEKSEDDCHRHILADIMRSKGYNIKEWKEEYVINESKN